MIKTKIQFRDEFVILLGSYAHIKCVDFNGKYMIEVEVNDEGRILPTGNGIDRNGNILSFRDTEFIVTYVYGLIKKGCKND